MATANYAGTPRTEVAQISSANTSRDGSGAVVTVFAAHAANGSRIDDVLVVAAGTTTAGVVRLFLTDGSSTWLWREILVSAVTPSTTLAVFTATLTNLALVLEAGWSLKASTHNNETFNVCVTRAGDF